MIDYKSGWLWGNPRSGDDPAFKLREIAEYPHLTHAVVQTQYVRYQFQFPLQVDPGSKESYSYCNYRYDVLGMVVAKASGTSFIQYLQTAIATPSGAGIVAISPTLDPRLPGEVAHYFNDEVGPSAIFVTSNKLKRRRR